MCREKMYSQQELMYARMVFEQVAEKDKTTVEKVRESIRNGMMELMAVEGNYVSTELHKKWGTSFEEGNIPEPEEFFLWLAETMEREVKGRSRS